MKKYYDLEKAIKNAAIGRPVRTVSYLSTSLLKIFPSVTLVPRKQDAASGKAPAVVKASVLK